MTTLRSYLDPDQQPATGPTPFITEQNEHELRCDLCARSVYVDAETYRFVSDAPNAGFDNAFRCEDCEEELDDLTYQR